MSIHIVELYSRHLAINGDMGNTLVLTRRAALAGLEVELTRYNPGDALPGNVDIALVGSGPASALRAISGDVTRVGPAIREWTSDGAAFLAVGAGFQLSGRSISGLTGSPIEGFGVFGAETDGAAPRVVTEDFVVETDFGRLVGIENHGSVTVLDDGQAPFGRVVRGVGNGQGGLRHGEEGARAANAFGTHLHGPVLAMNPVLADHLLTTAANRRGHVYARAAEHEHLDELARSTRALLDPASSALGAEQAAR